VQATPFSFDEFEVKKRRKEEKRKGSPDPGLPSALLMSEQLIEEKERGEIKKDLLLIFFGGTHRLSVRSTTEEKE